MSEYAGDFPLIRSPDSEVVPPRQYGGKGMPFSQRLQSYDARFSPASRARQVLAMAIRHGLRAESSVLEIGGHDGTAAVEARRLGLIGPYTMVEPYPRMEKNRWLEPRQSGPAN